MNTTKKVMFASASGAMIGYAVASQLLHGWLFLGAIIGAIAGWFLYDPAQFFASVRGAVACIKKDHFNDAVWMTSANRKIIRRYACRGLFELLCFSQLIGSTVGYLIGGGILALRIIADGSSFSLMECTLSVLYAGLFVTGLVTIVLGFIHCCDLLRVLIRRKSQQVLIEWQANLDEKNPDKEFDWNDLLKFNLVTTPFIGVALLVWLLFMFVFAGVPFLFKFSWLVTIMTFRLAHSNGRLSSAIGGALGALVGLWAGYLIVAMLVGAVAGGIAHYVGASCSAEYVEELKVNLTGKKVKA